MEATSEYADRYFSCAELAKMGLPNFPGSERGVLDRVKEEGWPFVEVKARGRSGVRRDYKPPSAILALIEQHQRGVLPPVPVKGKSAKEVQYQTMQSGDGRMMMAMEKVPSSAPHEINQHIQWMCLDACLTVYGPAFAAENAALQLEHATDLYNLLVRLATVKIGDKAAALEDFNRIDAEQMADLQRLFLTMRWLKPYQPAPKMPPGIDSLIF